MKNPDVYKLEDKLKMLYKVLLVVAGVVTIPLIIFGIITQKALFLYIALAVIVIEFVIAIISFPIACWVELQKQKLRDTEKVFQTFNRFE